MILDILVQLVFNRIVNRTIIIKHTCTHNYYSAAIIRLFVGRGFVAPIVGC